MYCKREIENRLLSVLIFCLFASISLAKYSGGTGEPSAPYQLANISDWQQLMDTSADWNKNFIMIDDVNLYSATLTSIGNSTVKFTGVFNGNNHVVRRPFINSGNIGLFGRLESGGHILNLGVVDVNATGNMIGGLLGYNYGGTVSNCHISGIVIGTENVGGLVGYNLSGTISNSSSSAKVKGINCIGGLVGENGSLGIIDKCYATGNVIGTDTYSATIGGLVGTTAGPLINSYATGSVRGYFSVGGLAGTVNADTSITSCYALGSVEGSEDVGGLAGDISYGSTVSKCFAKGSVYGDYYTGGLVGLSCEGTIESCYSAGTVMGYNCTGGLVGKMTIEFGSAAIIRSYSVGRIIGNISNGGLVGIKTGGTVTSSFWDKDTSGITTSAAGTGKTDAEMKTRSTFTNAGWDFANETANGTNDIWRMCIDGFFYPAMNWNYKHGDFVCPDTVDYLDLAYFSNNWLYDSQDNGASFDTKTDLNNDGIINIQDYALFAQYWFNEPGRDGYIISLDVGDSGIYFPFSIVQQNKILYFKCCFNDNCPEPGNIYLRVSIDGNLIRIEKLFKIDKSCTGSTSLIPVTALLGPFPSGHYVVDIIDHFAHDEFSIGTTEVTIP